MHGGDLAQPTPAAGLGATDLRRCSRL